MELAITCVYFLQIAIAKEPGLIFRLLDVVTSSNSKLDLVPERFGHTLTKKKAARGFLGATHDTLIAKRVNIYPYLLVFLYPFALAFV